MTTTTLLLPAQIKVGGADECWPWTGPTDRGYGRVSYKGTRWRAHRLAYALLVGPIPDELVTDHLCRNRACCNPSHMELVGSRVNTLRGNGIAATNARKTHCLRGHPLTGENLRPTSTGKRLCRAYHKASRRRAG